VYGLSVAEYVRTNRIEGITIRDKETVRYHARLRQPDALEDEIDRLRALMVELFIKEQSMTADVVIEISRRLDEKINAFMERAKRSR
jgi:tryptophan synthase beta subunit